jgi:hypothetical protein
MPFKMVTGFKIFKSISRPENKKEIDNMIVTEKIESTVPKVVSVVAKLRADKAALEKNVSDMLVEAAVDQKKIDELEAILASLVSEGGESAGGVV